MTYFPFLKVDIYESDNIAQQKTSQVKKFNFFEFFLLTLFFTYDKNRVERRYKMLNDWNQLIIIQKMLLEQILKDFDEYEVNDPKAKAIITGRLEGLYNLGGKDDNK